MNYLSILRKKTIDDLKIYNQQFEKINRKAVPIAIIDDEKFPYTEMLRRHDFDLRELGDINDIKAIESYPIVLCDIKGVGTHFGSKFEGGHIIDEIDRHYPNKVKIAYTSQQFDPTYNKFFVMCDFSLKKDIDSDEWVECLDKAIKIISNPIEQWTKLRNSLIKHNVSSKILVDLENEFLKKILNKNNEFPKNRTLLKLPDEARTIILNLVSNAIFNSIIGFSK